MVPMAKGTVQGMPVQDEIHENTGSIRARARKQRGVSSFTIVTQLNLDMDLAYALGELILASKTVNTALLSMGHQLVGD